MPKTLTLISLLIGLVLTILFGIDLAIELPFGRASMGLDIAFVVCGIAMLVLSWMTYRELR